MSDPVRKSEIRPLSPEDRTLIEQIADWYGGEWGMSKETTFRRLSDVSATRIPVQLLCFVNGNPVATAGLYSEVGLFQEHPVYQGYGPWLALVYVTPEQRNRGIGSELCRAIEKTAASLGYTELFLYTSTAESVYARIGWMTTDRLIYKNQKTVVMRKTVF
jgi:GNAT superfamily N-acetyltransferase